MNKFNKIATTINSTQELSEMEQQVRDVKNSNLNEEEKQKALKSHNKMIKTTIIVTISIILLIAIICSIICNIVDSNLKIVLCLITAVLGIVGLIFFAIFGRKLFPDWTNYYDKVDRGFDGLTENEINQLKPQANEKKVIKYYHKQSCKYVIIFLLALAIEFSILLRIGVPIYSPITIIITVVITIVWYIKENTCQVEIHRIKSGYYKKSIDFQCEKCKNEVKIKFEEIDKYNSLPKNEKGIRVMPCPKCNNPVPFYNFDIIMQDYKKYLEKIK